MQLFGFKFNALELSLAATVIVTLAIQLYYYLVYYARIPGYRQHVKKGVSPPVSVVLVINDNLEYVEQVLPLILKQDYPVFEVVVVDNGSSQEVIECLEGYTHNYPNLKTTRINPDPKFTSRRKLALTVGIKAATHPNIIFTEPDSYPVSDKWLSLMSKGFSSSDVVLGYCGIAPQPGMANKLIRCSRLMLSVRYLSSAMAGKPYRGISQNLGFTSNLYFESRGYTHLRLNVGEDDLFIQKVANNHNTSIIINPNAMVRQHQYGGLTQWKNERKHFSYAFKFYPSSVKRNIAIELLSRWLFFVSALAMLAMGVHIFWIGALGALVLRYFVVTFTISRICRRLGEKGLVGIFVIHDFISPVSEFCLAISRRLRPSKGLWG